MDGTRLHKCGNGTSCSAYVGMGQLELVDEDSYTLIFFSQIDHGTDKWNR